MGEIKSLFLLSITISLMVVLSACTDVSGTPIEPNKNNMIINIKNNSHFDFYGLEVILLNHSSGMVNADSSKIKKGQEFRFEFLEEDFELEGEAEMEIFILADTNIEDNGDRVPSNKKIAFELAENKEIFFEITGDNIKEADLNRVNE